LDSLAEAGELPALVKAPRKGAILQSVGGCTIGTQERKGAGGMSPRGERLD